MSGPVTFDYCDSALTCTPGAIGRPSGSGWHSGSGARSAYGFSSGEGIAISFNCGPNNGFVMAGFASSNYPTSGSYTNGHNLGRYLIFCYVGSIYLVESGSHKPLQGTYTTSDVLEVRLAANGVVTYAKGGSVFYTSTASPAAHYPLYAAAAIYSPINPALSNVQYVAAV